MLGQASLPLFVFAKQDLNLGLRLERVYHSREVLMVTNDVSIVDVSLEWESCHMPSLQVSRNLTLIPHIKSLLTLSLRPLDSLACTADLNRQAFRMRLPNRSKIEQTNPGSRQIRQGLVLSGHIYEIKNRSARLGFARGFSDWLLLSVAVFFCAQTIWSADLFFDFYFLALLPFIRERHAF